MDRRRLALWLTMAWGAGSRRIEAVLTGVRDPERFERAVRQNRREEFAAQLAPEAAHRLRRVEEDAVTAMLRALDDRGFEMLERGDGRYPERLAQIPGAPPLLFVEGNLDGLDEEMALAVVGTRRISEAGGELTRALALDLAGRGVTLVSGMALGADGIAHRAALERGARTIAVLACGLDRTYPAEHEALRRAIAAAGAVVSEQPLGIPPLPAYFLHRNRILTGLAMGVLVTEAPARSGALNSARHAAEQGRDVFVALPPDGVPRENNEGGIQLMEDGAIGVRRAEEILAAYRGSYRLTLEPRSAGGMRTERSRPAPAAPRPDPPAPAGPPTRPEGVSETALRLWELMDGRIWQADALAAAAGIPAAGLMAALTELELTGFITSHPGRRYSRAR